MKKFRKISIIGAGAMRAAYAAMFSDAGEFSVSFVARGERCKRLREGSLTVSGKSVKTGKEWWMKEPYGEGLANHTGPESCGGSCNATAEALAGVRAGQVLSRKSYLTLECRRCGTVRKATLDMSLSRDIFGLCTVGDFVHERKHLTREPGDPISDLDEGH